MWERTRLARTGHAPDDLATIRLLADFKQTGEPAHEELPARPLPNGSWQLLSTPGLVLGVAAGDVVQVADDGRFEVLDRGGNVAVQLIGAIREVGQSSAKKALRMLSSVDQFLTHKLQVVDHLGNVLLALTRPAKVLKSRVIVQDGMGAEIGTIVQQNAIGKIRFSLEAGGHSWGSINAENWRAWNFNIQDHTGAEIARITKTWEGLAKTMFTTADNYVVQIHRPLDEPLRSLVVAAALGVDTALKQDARGFG